MVTQQLLNPLQETRQNPLLPFKLSIDSYALALAQKTGCSPSWMPIFP